MTNEELQLDVEPDEARALHRVVRAMHDGNCPNCGYLAPSEYFWKDDPSKPNEEGKHECPCCQFSITETEARSAMMAFRPYMKKSVDIFNKWRRGEDP